MISPELTEKAGLKLIGVIAKMYASEARAHLAGTGQFAAQEIDELLTICKHPAVVQQSRFDYHFQRRYCLAALWLLGGSWFQIAELYGVSRQTVMDIAHKVMKGDRSRLAAHCTYEQLSEYNALFWKLSGEQVINFSSPDIHPSAVAGLLYAAWRNQEIDDAEPY